MPRPHPVRLRSRLTPAIATLMAASLVLHPADAGLAAGGVSVQVTLAPSGGSGITGLAILSPDPAGGSDVQLLASGAPAQTFAVIHGGTCDAIDQAPVALLGDAGSGNLQVTLPNDFATLADGAHVLALHAGLDLGAAVACGEIPRATLTSEGPTAQASAAPPGPARTGGAYAAPTSGFALTWDASWSEYPLPEQAAGDQVGLSDGVSTIVVSGVVEPGSDAQTCVRNASGTLLDQLAGGSIRSLEQLTSAEGLPVSGGDPSRAWTGYQYVLVGGKADGADVAEYHECRAAHGTVVHVLHRSPVYFYDQAVVAREALLAGLTMPDAPPPQPSPTGDPACAGASTWIDATNTRLDRVADLRGEADDLLDRLDVDGYTALLPRFATEVHRMADDQGSDPVPPIAADANVLALRVFELFGLAGDRLVEYYTVRASQQLYSSAIGAIKDAETAAADLRAAMSDIESACG